MSSEGGAGVTRPDTGVRGRQDAWFLRRYARAFDDLGADLREGRAPAPPVSPENRRVAAFRVVLVARGRSRAANLPSVERSEGTTGFSRWGNRVKFQL